MKRFVAELIGFVALTLAVPLAAEVVLRLLDVRTETPVFQPATDADGSAIMRLAWNPQLRTPQPAQPHREFPVEKAPGTFRIFVVGESEAEGVPYGTDLAFSSWRERRLARQAREGTGGSATLPAALCRAGAPSRSSPPSPASTPIS